MGKTMTVWHAKLPNWGRENPEFTPENYTMVAILEEGDNCDEDLDFAFRRTQHIDGPWWDANEVTLVGKSEHRSTSVGDVVFRDGLAWRCASVGWTLLSPEVK